MKIPDFGKLTLRLLGAVSRTDHLLLQEIKVTSKSWLRKRTKLDILRDTGVVVMASRSSKQKRYSLNVPFKKKIKSGVLIVMGTNKQLNEFSKYPK